MEIAGKHRLPELDALRGWAIVLVVAFHCKGILLGDVPLAADASALWSPVWVGNSGVTLFFVLSGYLLSLPFLAGLARGKLPSVPAFFLSRALRIVPMYYLAVAWAWAATGQTSVALHALLFLPTSFSMYPYNVVWWSLCLEVQFLLLLPAAMGAAQTRAGRRVLAVALAAWVLLFATICVDPGWLAWFHDSPLRASIFPRIPDFLVGVGAAVLHRRTSGDGSPGAWRLAALPAAVLLGMLLHEVALTGTTEASERLPWLHAPEAVLWGVLLLAAVGADGPVSRVLLNPLLRHFGRISYSLYLVHLPVLSYVLLPRSLTLGQGNPALFDATGLALLTKGIALAWAAALAAHLLVEQPFLRMKSRIQNRLRQAAMP